MIPFKYVDFQFEREQLTIEQRRVIFSVFPPLSEANYWPDLTRVVDGRYVYYMQQRPAIEIVLLDLFHEKIK